MKNKIMLTLLISLCFISLLWSSDLKIYQGDRTTLKADVPDFVGYVPNEIVVKFKSSVLNKINIHQLNSGSGLIGIQRVDQLNQKYAANRIKEMFPQAKPTTYNNQVINLSGYYKIRFTNNFDDIEKVVADYAKLSEVEKAEPIGIHSVHAMPNDGYFADQWHLNQNNDHDVDAPEAWDCETGDDDVIVGILDTGVRYFHKDLGGSNTSYTSPETADGNMWINSAEKNGVAGVDDDGNGFIDDWIGWDFVHDVSSFIHPVMEGEDGNDPDNDPRDFQGHGTHCAGNIAAINNNGYATCAVSGGWGGNGNGVKVMALRIGWACLLYRRVETGQVRMDFAAEAMYYAADEGAKIISCSWGSSNSGGLADAASYFISHGGLIFKSAGNDGTNSSDYLCSRTDVISVASTDQNDCKSDFSNYGNWVDISAPGTGIMSLYHNHEDPENDYVAVMDGTSMASPIAASTAALIWSKNPGWSASQVKQKLFDSADNIDGESCNSSYAGQLGSGRVNAAQAVDCAGCPTPVAEFFGTPTEGTVPLTVSFTNQSTNNPTIWNWDFGDGGTSTEQNPAHQYTEAGTFTVTLTATNSCGSDEETKVDYITVNPCLVPGADFVGSPTSGTAPLTVTFTDQSTNNPTIWHWDFGDGASATEQNPTHEYSTDGTYTVVLIATNSCGSDTAAKENYISVSPCVTPTADFVGSPTSGQAPLTVNFTDQSTDNPTSWSWDFGDGGTSSDQNPTHEYTAEGTYTVILIATNSCGSDTAAQENYINVSPCVTPTADFVGSPTSGQAPLMVNFTDQSTNNPTSWSWDFGDGGTSTEQNPTHEYTTAGTYTVILIATNSCGSDTTGKSDYITVEPCNPPVAAFVGSPLEGDVPLTVTFTDQSTNNPTSWNWDFGDGGTSTQQNPMHEYSTAGTYTVSLTATNNCGSDSETKPDYITVNPGANLMHVNAIDVTKERWFILYRGKARVKIVDAGGNPVSDAQVTGEWSGSTSGSASANTAADGWATLYSSWVWGSSSFTFCVTNVTKTNWIYDESANEVTCGSTNNAVESIASVTTINLDEMDESIKKKLAFSYPNPFNATTVISFFVPETDQVKVEIYNVLGKKIATLINKNLDAGVHSVNWNSTDEKGNMVGSGNYFFKISFSNGQSMIRKMTLIK